VDIAHRHISSPWAARNTTSHEWRHYFWIRGCIQKFPDLVDNEINNKHPLRNDKKRYW